MRKPTCCDEQGTSRKGAWTKQEDRKLTDYIQTYGEGSWSTIPKAAGPLILTLIIYSLK